MSKDLEQFIIKLYIHHNISLAFISKLFFILSYIQLHFLEPRLYYINFYLSL